VVVEFAFDPVEASFESIALPLFLVECVPLGDEVVELLADVVDVGEGLLAEAAQSIERGFDLVGVDVATAGPAGDGFVRDQLIGDGVVFIGRRVVEGIEATDVVAVEHVLVELDDALKLGEFAFEAVLALTEPFDLAVEFAALAGGRVGEVVVVGFELGTFVVEGVDALLVGVDIVADVFELRARPAEFVERVFEFGLLLAGLVDVAIGIVELGFLRFEFVTFLRDLLVEASSFGFEIGEVTFERVELLQSIVELAAAVLQFADLGADDVGIDRAHDQITEVVAAGDRPTGLVRFEEEGEQVGDDRVVEIGLTVGGDGAVLTRERARVRVVPDGKFDGSLVGIALERDAIAAESCHHGLEQRRAVGGVAAGENGHAPGRLDVGTVDTTDVLDVYVNIPLSEFFCVH
jgi:hypothetical protein